jgi:DNA-binding winged helix-turn-helix (wHTH) protein
METPVERHFRFGVFQAFPERGELRKNSRRIALQDQPFRVLVLLLQRGGELVTREELQKALWPSASYGDFDQGVNTAVKKLRQALGDTASNPRFIETVPRQGYRFRAAHGPRSDWKSGYIQASVLGGRERNRNTRSVHSGKPTILRRASIADRREAEPVPAPVG